MLLTQRTLKLKTWKKYSKTNKTVSIPFDKIRPTRDRNERATSRSVFIPFKRMPQDDENLTEKTHRFNQFIFGNRNPKKCIATLFIIEILLRTINLKSNYLKNSDLV